jgi:two-component system cell cycle sensor histidine kinase/response regulator CckA
MTDARIDASIRRDGPTPALMLAGAAAGAVLGAAGLAAAGVAAPEASSVMAWAASAGLGALGGGALLWGAAARKTPDPDAVSFSALFRDATYASALSDETGALRAVNPALSAAARARGEPEPRTAAEALAIWSDAPDALAYRLARTALEDGLASEDLARGRGPVQRVFARRLRDDLLLWTAQAGDRRADGAQADPAGSDALIERLPVALARLAPDGSILFANAAARALLGPKAGPGATIGKLVEGLGRSMETRIAEAMRGDSSGRPEIARAEPEGREVFLQVSLTRLTIEGEDSLVAVFADATELKTLEAQFVQSQKMQAVGQLAGGVAHDFNNLLTAISGHCDLLLQRHEQGDSDYADLIQIRQNANRAAALVRQLLAFSRKQTLKPKVVNLVDALAEISHLLNRLLGERVSLRIEAADDLDLVKVDERQFEQVVMNLVVNARDAMAGEGEVTIRAENVRVTDETRRGRAVMPRGDYVRIDVVDTGVGIPADKIDQIFEPFFTTKKQGEGTGLGLSTVYGIVKQTGGFIFADSRPGEGAIFSIYLPRCEPEAPAVAEPRRVAPPEDDLTGRGVVLLIEDEAPVRAFAARALKLRGYEVLEAANAEEALELLEDPSLHVDVLVSDVVMPGMDGPSCVREARRARPDVKVVFVSGYAEDSLKRGMEGLENCSFLPKPFSLNELTAKVKECVSS